MKKQVIVLTVISFDRNKFGSIYKIEQREIKAFNTVPDLLRWHESLATDYGLPGYEGMSKALRNFRWQKEIAPLGIEDSYRWIVTVERLPLHRQKDE